MHAVVQSVRDNGNGTGGQERDLGPYGLSRGYCRRGMHAWVNMCELVAIGVLLRVGVVARSVSLHIRDSRGAQGEC